MIDTQYHDLLVVYPGYAVHDCLELDAECCACQNLPKSKHGHVEVGYGNGHIDLLFATRLLCLSVELYTSPTAHAASGLVYYQGPRRSLSTMGPAYAKLPAFMHYAVGMQHTTSAAAYAAVQEVCLLVSCYVV